VNDTYHDLRRQVRAASTGLVPDKHLDEVVDLAMHAVIRSFEVVGEIVTRASVAPAAICATSIALSIIKAEAEAKLEGLMAVAEAAGMSRTIKTVSAGGQTHG
jgi:hypothetical protein